MRKGSSATNVAHSVSSNTSFSVPTSLTLRKPAKIVDQSRQAVGQPPLGTSTSTTSNTPPTSGSTGPQLDPALRNALETYIQKLPESERTAYLAASSMDPGLLLERVRKLDDQKAQRSKLRPWTKRLTNFLNMIDRSIGGVAIVIQANPDVSSIVVGGAKLIIDIAIRFAVYLDELVEMLDRLSDYLPLLNKYAEHSHLPDICKALSGIYLDILNFYSTARKVYVDRNGQLKRFASLRLLLRAQWKPFSAEFGPIMASIQHHYTVLSRSGVAELFSGQEEIQTRLQEIQTRQHEHQKEEFFGWLSAHNFELRQLESLEACHQGTGRWLFDTHEFRVWATTQESNLLWCHGKRTYPLICV
jgi:plasmid maintenance system antidote protein VapI